MFDRIVDGYTFEIKDLAPAEYGGKYFYVFRGGQDEDGVVRGSSSVSETR